MNLIIRGKKGGKTTELIRMCAEQGGYIVCVSREEATRIFHRAQKMGLRIPFPLTAEEWRRCDYSVRVERLYFDNLDLILRDISKVPVEAATWTGYPAQETPVV